MKPEILSMGTMYVDINAKGFPYGDGIKPNTEVIGNDYEVVPGGSALNFARFCAALELNPVFVGKVGNDVMGKVLADLATKSGVIPAFITSDAVKTNIGMNFLGENGSSIMTVVGSANQSLSGDEVLGKMDEFTNDVDFVYLGGCFKLKTLMPKYGDIAEKAHEKNAKVVLDHGRVTNTVTEEDKEVIRNLIPNIDYYLPSKDEFLSLWNVASIEEGITKVRETSSAVVVVKDAENGAIGFNEKDKVEVPAFPVTAGNTIGAGDSFNAGFIKAQSLGMSLEESMRFACATAAIKISKSDLPIVEKVNKLISS